MDKQNLLFQHDICWQLFLYHIKNLSEKESMWCKTMDGLQIRNIGNSFKADIPKSEEYAIGPPSISWILWHIIYWWQATINHSFGDGTVTMENIIFPKNVDLAIKEIFSLHDQWINIIQQMPEDKLKSNAYSKFPFTDSSFYNIALWLNVELMKNAAEIGSVRFLYAVENKA